MERQFVGHVATQLPHWMHMKGSIVQVRSVFATVMQWHGQTRWHLLQRMHSVTSFITCPFCPA